MEENKDVSEEVLNGDVTANGCAIVNGQPVNIKDDKLFKRTVFLAGWRPALGWVCVGSLGWSWVAVPIFQSVLNVFRFGVTLTSINGNVIYGMVALLMGLAGLRTFEKVKDKTE